MTTATETRHRGGRGVPSVPGFVVVGIWQFTSIWNEFGPRPRGRDIVLTGVMTHAIAVERVAAAVRLRGLYP